MRFTILLLAIVPLALAATDAQNRETCQKKYGSGVLNAINDFCGYNNIVVPGKYAAAGKWNGKYQVKIDGNCGPPEWVPPYWCGVQMRETCAATGGNGVGQKNYGWAGCQKFIVDNSNFLVQGE